MCTDIFLKAICIRLHLKTSSFGFIDSNQFSTSPETDQLFFQRNNNNSVPNACKTTFDVFMRRSFSSGLLHESAHPPF